MWMNPATSIAPINGGNNMKRWKHAGLALFAIAMLLAGGCSKNEDHERVEKCQAMDMIRVGEYVLVNDDSDHPAYTQCIFQDSSMQTMGWSWSEITPAPEPSRKSTCAYLFSGQAQYIPPGMELSTNPVFPISVSNIESLSLDYDVEVATNSSYSVGFSTSEYWYGVGFRMGASLSVIVASNQPGSSVDFQARVLIDGEEYDFYKNTTSGQSMSSNYWFIKVNPSFWGTLHFQKFLEFLYAEGYSAQDRKIGQVEHLNFFQNIWDGGSGRTTIRNYAITVKSRVS
jgi:hypothetical protein